MIHRQQMSHQTVQQQETAAVTKSPLRQVRLPQPLLLFTLAVYGGGVYYYSSHFPHNTLINHVKVGEMDVTKAEKTFTDDLASHKISLKRKGTYRSY